MQSSRVQAQALLQRETHLWVQEGHKPCTKPANALLRTMFPFLSFAILSL